MTLELFRAESEFDREALFRFRYSVYVEEMGRYRGVADHAARRLVEPEDAHSVLYGARQDGTIVGTARTTFGSDGFSARQLEQYQLGPFLAEVPAPLAAVAERLMVASRLRGSAVNLKLRELTHEDLPAAGVRLLFGHCEPHLLSLYLASGWRTYSERNVSSAEAGYLIPLVFVVGDLASLAAAIGHRDASGSPSLPASLEAALSRPGAVSSASLSPPEEYLAQLEERLDRLEQQPTHAFAGMNKSEVADCVARSNIIECAPGDHVLMEGGSSHNLFLVLDGTLEIRHHGKLLDVLAPGDIFGEMAFLLELPRQSDVYASTPDVRILSLSDGTLRTLMAERPALAAKLLLNISRMLCARLIKARPPDGV
jgi:hypothetical protein